MQLEYRLSLKDYQEFSHANLKLQRWIYFYFWFWMLFVLFLIVLLFLTQTIIDSFHKIVGFLLFAIIFCNPYFSNPIMGYILSLAWKQFTYLHHPITFEANEEILKFKSVNYENIAFLK